MEPSSMAIMMSMRNRKAKPPHRKAKPPQMYSMLFSALNFAQYAGHRLFL